MHQSLRDKLPGLLVASLIGAAALLLATGLRRIEDLATHLPVSAALLAILAGLALAPLAARRPQWSAGLSLAAGPWLKLGVVLLGLRLSLGEIARLGLEAVGLVITAILAGLLIMALLTRWLKLPGRLGTLLGVGTAICGVSAIAATAPGIGARREETAYAIACVALFGLLATLAYPLLFHVLLDEPRLVGMALGAAIHDTAQVTGAALLYEQSQQAPEALNAATVTKLLRNLGILLVVPLVIALAARRGLGSGHGASFPLFILGFLAMAAVRTAGDALIPADHGLWQALLNLAEQLSGLLFAIALAAMGLRLRLGELRRLGAAPLAAAVLAALAVGSAATLYLLVLPG